MFDRLGRLYLHAKRWAARLVPAWLKRKPEPPPPPKARVDTPSLLFACLTADFRDAYGQQTPRGPVYGAAGTTRRWECAIEWHKYDREDDQTGHLMDAARRMGKEAGQLGVTSMSESLTSDPRTGVETLTWRGLLRA